MKRTYILVVVIIVLVIALGYMIFVKKGEEKVNIDVPAETAQTKVEQANVVLEDEKPIINSAVFDGNGVVIEGEKLAGSFVAFTGKTGGFCREMVTSNCVLQKSVSTDTTIKFISNMIGGAGSYRIYVENPKTGESNSVDFTITK